MQILKFQHLGNRKEQQDAYYISPDNRFFVVCDGLGGTDDGALASNVLVSALRENYQDLMGTLEVTNFQSFLNKSIQQVSDLQGVNTATTLVCLLLDNGTAYYSHIGDSKLFYFSPAKCNWLATKDHSFVQELYDAGVLATEEEMRDHPKKNLITRAISSHGTSYTAINEIYRIDGLTRGDFFILCTDGAVEDYTTGDFASLFYSNIEAFESSFNELDNKCKVDSKDNSTLILIKL